MLAASANSDAAILNLKDDDGKMTHDFNSVGIVID